MRRRRIPLALTALLAGLVAIHVAAPVGAQDTSTLLVVLDVSGSMKETVKGGVKRDLARRGLLRTLESLAPGTSVGLRLLGEGAAGAECGASRTAVPFGPFDQPAWESALGAVRWDGATPLVHSMREALADLGRVTSDRREMLIIGDGDDTCGEDPVGVARAEAGGIRIHTISLGEAASPQLAGIALVTGGTYARAFDDATFAVAAGAALPTAPVAAAPPGAPAAVASRLEVILDVSNSMWGQVDGRAKITLAREALAQALADVPADVPVGFRAYGHRVAVDDKAAGCRDTERLVPSAPGNAGAIVTLAAGLTPRGQTPIARSLEEAAVDLQKDGGASVILLLTDGLESCGGDPAAVVARLRASGMPVVLHTVGLGVSARDAETLAALSSAGGGSYFNAPTAAGLLKGVGDVVRASRTFVMQTEAQSAFPRDVVRVRGGDDVAAVEIIGPGAYSFTEHLFRAERYFAVRGTPGETLTLRGLVCALEVGRPRPGQLSYLGLPNMMTAERIDARGMRLRGGSLTVRGDMGTWSEMALVVGDDGLARFRIGRATGNVHRDMIFAVGRGR